MDAARPDSHLFAVRLWPAAGPEDGTGWRGQVTHVLSGETRHFREWAELVDRLAAMVEQIDALQEGD